MSLPLLVFISSCMFPPHPLPPSPPPLPPSLPLPLPLPSPPSLPPSPPLPLPPLPPSLSQEAQVYAEENSLLFMETSAKTAMNVNDIFLAIGTYMYMYEPSSLSAWCCNWVSRVQSSKVTGESVAISNLCPLQPRDYRRALRRSRERALGVANPTSGTLNPASHRSAMPSPWLRITHYCNTQNALYYSPWFLAKNIWTQFQQTSISLERASQEEHNDTKFCSIAPSSEELWVLKENTSYQ